MTDRPQTDQSFLQTQRELLEKRSDKKVLHLKKLQDSGCRSIKSPPVFFMKKKKIKIGVKEEKNDIFDVGVMEKDRKKANRDFKKILLKIEKNATFNQRYIETPLRKKNFENDITFQNMETERLPRVPALTNF